MDTGHPECLVYYEHAWPKGYQNVLYVQYSYPFNIHTPLPFAFILIFIIIIIIIIIIIYFLFDQDAKQKKLLKNWCCRIPRNVSAKSVCYYFFFIIYCPNDFLTLFLQI